MNYFIANLFRDKVLWGVLGLAALTGLIIVDLLTFMLMPSPVFNLWVVKITLASALLGLIFYALFLYKHDKKEKRLDAILPDLLAERRVLYEKKGVEDPEFQTLCHKCRYFDLNHLRCLLVLRERKAWIKLNYDSPILYCLYWNLDDRHPVMLLTAILKVVSEKSANEDNGKKGQ